MDILQIKNLSFKYPDCEKNALDNINLSVKSGEFILLCGHTGCGKSTLIKMIKRQLTPTGEKNGEILYFGESIDLLDERRSVCDIGYVMQRPENQIVTDKVWHEIAFGLENLGFDNNVIRRRVSEMSSYFGIGHWFDKATNQLSGGQKQLLNLAAVMVMQPKILILDEPTAQLDPIAASDFIATLDKLNKETGITIILVEHRLEEVFSIVDRVVVMRSGSIFCCDKPQNVIDTVKNDAQIISSFPAAARLYAAVNINKKCPVTVKQGREFLVSNFYNDIKSVERIKETQITETAVQFKDVCFRYDKNSPDVLKNTTFDINKNEIFAFLGANASGKSTTLKIAGGLYKPYSGSVRLFGKKIEKYTNDSLYRNNIALLNQDVSTVFSHDTVYEDVKSACDNGVITEYFDIKHLYNKHPYDLSGGEQQKAALLKILQLRPKILLLDEPTKGIDSFAKNEIIKILKTLKEQGITIVVVTHDVEFAALAADRCALFFNGQVAGIDSPDKFFNENNFYTTAANRMSKYIFNNAVTVDDLIWLCKKNGVRYE